ncbi:hypothetical protein ACJQWY_06505 [Weissella kandleri]|uniref:hypothetical protein n=1 Tax=Weissella kandleri TaxID=1616 RepID=UPI00387EBBDF
MNRRYIEKDIQDIANKRKKKVSSNKNANKLMNSMSIFMGIVVIIGLIRVLISL